MNSERTANSLAPTCRTVGLFCLVMLSLGAGCSSPGANSPYSNLKLSEIRQAPGGQLALIYDEKRGRPPGQRIFLANAQEIERDLIVAQQELEQNKGYSAMCAGGVILHRRKALDGQSQDTYWMQLDPFELAGKWTPPLSESALSVGVAANSLPLPWESPSLTAQIATSSLNSPAFNLLEHSAKPDQHFLWQTANGMIETSVAAQPLIRADPHNNLVDRTGQVIGGGLFAAGLGSILALEIIADLHDDCNQNHRPYSHP